MIDTEAKRNAALLDECGILIPSGVIAAASRQALLGDYLPSSPAPGGRSYMASCGFGGPGPPVGIIDFN